MDDKRLITGCLLAGGEGRRMQGRDKGLVELQRIPLASHALARLLPQVGQVFISANRNQDRYLELLRQAQAQAHSAQLPDSLAADTSVFPDDPDLGEKAGPLAGIVSALRRTETDWLMVVPCDTPYLPPHLVSSLLQAGTQRNADIVVPESGSGDHFHQHWVCALMHKRVYPQTLTAFVKGERKMSRWIQSQNWTSVSFADPADFANFNTLETLNEPD
ncbi:MAG: molybdenum cofactor guanylyltransferase MobA [Aquabacterium sp.]|uniref:molybdenum cofactor guanylyltransferase MobA n=1 Tax=Aquabacterium sp. TaxID=1872578 RepID=UPI003BDCA130